MLRNSEITRFEYVKSIAFKFCTRADLWLTCSLSDCLCVMNIFHNVVNIFEILASSFIIKTLLCFIIWYPK
jgi:hypothetical protein